MKHALSAFADDKTDCPKSGASGWYGEEYSLQAADLGTLQK